MSTNEKKQPGKIILSIIAALIFLLGLGIGILLTKTSNPAPIIIEKNSP
jgi:F0F1-type ATP synthase assembly protein I